MTIHKSTAAIVLSRRALLLSGVVMAALSAFSPMTAAVISEERTKVENKMTTATTQPNKASATASKEIRPFRAHFPDEALANLKRRIAATQWPERETVSDQSQGVPLATMQDLARYWATDYDWRKAEAKLNALPQFVTNIDGLDIHFIHV